MKEIVALVGSYDDNARHFLHEGLKNFELIELDCKENYSKMANASYVILRTLSIGKDTIEVMPRLKLIQRWGVGYNTVDIEAAGEAGVMVAVTTGINALPVAEYTILLMLSVYRNLISINSNVRNGVWKDNSLVNRSYMINAKTVGLIGLGAIGKEVARKARGLGARVVYYDNIRQPAETEAVLGITYKAFDELVESADIISLHLSLNENTKNLIDKDVLARMKPTSILINTARGGIINEVDLYNALRDGTILGAGLDVFEQEPISSDNPLLELDNVVVSSHCAGNTADNSEHMALRCVENIKKVYQGMPIAPEDLVNARYLRKDAIR